MSTTASFIPPEIVLGTTTSWLPVTTAYPSVSGCADAFFLFPGQPGPAAWDPGYGYFAGGTLRCLPPEATAWWEQNHQNPNGYTSLSIQPVVCPAAFTTAATELRSVSSTLILCCPSDYSLFGGQPGRATGECLSSLSSGQTVTYTAMDANSAWTLTTSAVGVATSISAVGFMGWNVAPSTTSTSLASPTSSPSSTPTSVAQSTHGLSIGAEAGIGIGVAFSVIAILCLAFLVFRRRRRQQHSARSAELATAFHSKPEVAYEMHHPEKVPAQEMYQDPSELESRQALKPESRNQ